MTTDQPYTPEPVRVPSYDNLGPEPCRGGVCVTDDPPYNTVCDQHAKCPACGRWNPYLGKEPRCLPTNCDLWRPVDKAKPEVVAKGRTLSPRDVIHAALAAGMPDGPGVTEPMRTRFAEVAVIETDNVLAALAEAGYFIHQPGGDHA